jgi:hypothetical protein
MRDPKRHVATIRELGSGDGPNIPGWTKWILIIGRLSPTADVGIGEDEYTEGFTVAFTRKYFYKIENVSDDRAQYFS